MGIPNTKDMEHKLSVKQPCVNIIVNENPPCTHQDKKSFLSNSENKPLFINMLGSYFREKRHSVIHRV